MDELETYRQQREQIELALVDDPENTELLKLKQDLTDLVDLMTMARGGAGAGGGGKGEAASSSKADKRRRGAAASADAAPPDVAGVSPNAAGAVGAQASPTAAARSPVGAAPAREWKVGEKCKARWSQDGKFYDSLITAASEAGVYSVTFTEYGDVALVRAHDLRPLHGGGGAPSSAGYKRRVSEEDPAADAAASADPAGPGATNGAASQQKTKKKKGTGKSEVAEKQNAWLSFAKKGPKAPHGKKASLLSKKSMFSTPDNPNAKCWTAFLPGTSMSQRRRTRRLEHPRRQCRNC